MISLAIHNIKDAVLDIAESIEEIPAQEYDWVLVDDTVPMYQESLSFSKKLSSSHTVLLYHPENKATEGFDILIAKPFLPDEIRQSIENHRETPPSTSEKSKINGEKADKKKVKMKTDKTQTQVLNLEEIETIKALLEEDGLEIVHEEELANTVLSEEHKATKKKKKQKRDPQQELIDAILKMKPKKIRKLLKGAKVTIKIKFPEDQ